MAAAGKTQDEITDTLKVSQKCVSKVLNDEVPFRYEKRRRFIVIMHLLVVKSGVWLYNLLQLIQYNYTTIRARVLQLVFNMERFMYKLKRTFPLVKSHLYLH
jgi:hypothetical protein